MEKNSRAKPAQDWVLQGWVTSSLEGCEVRTPGLRVPRLGLPGMGDLFGGKKRACVPIDHQFWVIFLQCSTKNEY